MIKFGSNKFKNFNKYLGQFLQCVVFITVGLCLTSSLIVGISIPFSDTWWEVVVSICIIVGCFSFGFWLLDWYGRNYWRTQPHKPIITVKYDVVMDDMIVLSNDDADRCVEVVALIDDGIEEWDCSDDVLYIDDAENNSKLD